MDPRNLFNTPLLPQTRKLDGAMVLGRMIVQATIPYFIFPGAFGARSPEFGAKTIPRLREGKVSYVSGLPRS